METWIWQPLTFLGAIGHQWIELMTGSALILGFAGIERLLRRQSRLVTYIFLCMLVLVGACFVAWRDEYVKNVGTVEVNFYTPPPFKATDDTIDQQVTMINTTNNVVVIKKIGLGRVTTVDKSPNLSDLVAPHCLETTTSFSQDERMHIMTSISMSSKFKDGSIFSYLRDMNVVGDKTLPIAVDPGRALILHVTFRGGEVDLNQFNGVALCPEIEYFERNGVVSAAICEGTTFSVVWGKKPPMRSGPDTLRFTIFPILEKIHCKSIFP